MERRTGNGLFLLKTVAVLALLLCPALQMAAQPQSDLDTIRSRYVASLLPQDAAGQQQILTAASLLKKSLSSNATWPDVDYSDAVRSDWRAAPHLEHTLILAKAAELDRERGRPDRALEAKALAAYRLWIVRDPHNPNWWWNEIGVPQLLCEIATLLRSQLTAADMGKLRPILMRAVWTKWTGANLVWGVGIQIVRGILYNDPAAVVQAYQRLYQEIRIVPPLDAKGRGYEGIQADYSFHQHGAQFYAGGYGRAFAEDVGRWLAFSWGTAMQIPPSRMQIFSAFLLDGEQWLIRGDVFDYSSVGREITRSEGQRRQNPGDTVGNHGSAYLLGTVVAALAAEPTPRRKEFKTFADRIAGVAGTPPFVGNKQFWTSDYMAQQRPAYLASIRMFSTRTQDYETVNGEGLKSMHLSDGMNLLYLTGNEYRGIFPVWDWTLLPGTTALHATQANGVPETFEVGGVPQQGQRGQTSFVGGVSDGQYGAAAMDLKRGPLRAKKSWFFFDRLYVALGAGINVSAGETNVEATTDVNQTLLTGEVRVNDSRRSCPNGTHLFPESALHTVWHDNTGYVLGSHTVATLSNQVQTGRWSEIGTGSNALVSKAVFNLWIHHGIAPHDATYQYTVLPGASISETAEEYRHPSVRVLSNTEAVQAVFSERLQRAEIIFRQVGALETPLGQIAVDHPVLLMVARSNDTLEVTAANPENEALIVHAKIAGHSATVRLPGGELAGSSVTVAIKLG